MKIRQFEASDTESVLNLANAHAIFDSPLTSADLAIAKHLPEAFIIAEEDAHIVGFVFGYIRDVPSEVLIRWNASKVGQVELLVVDPRSRRRGMGTMLLDRLFEIFSRNGVDIVTLHCPAEATEAKKLYNKTGFVTRAYAMKKRL